MSRRRPPGFREWKFRGGFLRVQERDDGSWVILATPPDIKLDNDHADHRPHLHPDGWESRDRRALRASLKPEEAREAITRHLARQGSFDVAALTEELA